MAVGVERDVQDMLMGQRQTKRSRGDIPYPVPEYTTDLANLDIWDNMFFESIWGSPTVYNFPSPPSFVLDLGCGTGWWIMHMAQRWPNTSFVGFDLAEIQPSLREYQHFDDIADRVSWVNGNFLDVFPFPDDHFDYVRVCRAGLAIPEDEWQWFLEQAWRVMRPGALLEIIEEDLIFPIPTLPGLPPEIAVTPSPSTPKYESQTTLNTLSSGSSCSTTIAEPTVSPNMNTQDERSPSKTKSKRGRLSSFRSTGTLTKVPSESPESHGRSSADSMSPDCIDIANHPQNHSKLKAAWDRMLARRFISGKVLSILPFYLSTIFSNLEIFHLYTVPLPTNTVLKYDIWDEEEDSLYSFPRPRRPLKHCPTVHINPDNLVNHPIVTDLPRLQAMDLYELAGMHLHYTVCFIKACKAAVQEEYQTLFPTDEGSRLSARVQRTVGSDLMAMLLPHCKTDPFEVEWNDWVCDMEDRMRLRHRLPGQMAWNEPRTPRGGKPLWRHWRKAIDQLLARDNKSVFDYPPKQQDSCRSVRAYMAWKGTKPTPVV
ncbi:hypothetical protein P691DRAFT_806248 [Macrolepiota fuliginosa MF-IS2]|uniref:Methyltransferase domain-containing protein n=1 Tax=Macrolepiota fuliginosa MF-IS2 TaxID=1400762 RepID=A0A9P5XLF8_9AGAR|nr:hypothetical protein P691DRAFT_806248 [Macrolepiota fuliginosa MF-IS2]